MTPQEHGNRGLTPVDLDSLDPAARAAVERFLATDNHFYRRPVAKKVGRKQRNLAIPVTRGSTPVKPDPPHSDVEHVTLNYSVSRRARRAPQ